jgi:molybdenum cofactor guanylyltransferase
LAPGVIIWGLILAGGRSRRFGSEKAAALLDGRPMLAHVAAALQPSVAALAINAPPDRFAAAWAAGHGLPCLADRDGDPDGPLSGVRVGMAWAAAGGATLLATTPCDVPRLPPDMVPRLAAALTPGAGAAVVRTAEGLHPLCTLWRVDRLVEVEAQLAKGHPPIRRVLADLGAVDVAFDDAAAFDNVNTPEDRARLAAS